MTKILDGKKLSGELAEKLAQQIKKLRSVPALLIIQVGNLASTNTYIKHKKSFAEKIGARVIHRQFPHTASESELIHAIAHGNRDPQIHGIIVQLPLPARLNKTKIIEAIDPKKDADGLTSKNFKTLLEGAPRLLPATTRGIITLLDHYQIPLSGQKVVVVGRSTLVGKPTALALLNRDATVTICHRQTRHLAQITKTADILIVAAGEVGLITPRHVNPRQVIIDVGINALPQKGSVTGDVAARAKTMIRAISPVPGGVGPMTVASLFQNLVDLY